MRVGLWASILLASSLGLAQNCTSYVVAAPVNPDTSEIMGDLKAADFEASLGDTPLLSSMPKRIFTAVFSFWWKARPLPNSTV